MKPPVETYVRAVWKPRDGVEMIVGLELRDGESFRDVQHELREYMRKTWFVHRHTCSDGLDIGRHLRDTIEFHYPNRWWFLETHLDDPDEGFVQMFQPFWRRDHL